MNDWILLPSGKTLNLAHVVFMSPYPTEVRTTIQEKVGYRYNVTTVTGIALSLDHDDAQALYTRLTHGAGKLKTEKERGE